MSLESAVLSTLSRSPLSQVQVWNQVVSDFPNSKLSDVVRALESLQSQGKVKKHGASFWYIEQKTSDIVFHQVGPRSAAELNRMNKLVADGMTPAEASKKVQDAVPYEGQSTKFRLKRQYEKLLAEAKGKHDPKIEEQLEAIENELARMGGADVNGAMASWLARADAEYHGNTGKIVSALASKFNLSEQEARDVLNDWRTADATVTPGAVKEAAIAAVKAGTSKASFVAGYSGGAAEMAAEQWEHWNAFKKKSELSTKD